MCEDPKLILEDTRDFLETIALSWEYREVNITWGKNEMILSYPAQLSHLQPDFTYLRDIKRCSNANEVSVCAKEDKIYISLTYKLSFRGLE